MPGQEITHVLHPGRDLEVRRERAAGRAPLQLGDGARRLEVEERDLEAAARDRGRRQQGP